MHRGLTKTDHATLRAKGSRAHLEGVMISAVRGDGDLCYGFTISKKNGNAVTRNRIRRRLDSALRDASLDLGLDLKVVLVVRNPSSLDTEYTKLVSDMKKALVQVDRKIQLS